MVFLTSANKLAFWISSFCDFTQFFLSILCSQFFTKPHSAKISHGLYLDLALLWLAKTLTRSGPKDNLGQVIVIHEWTKYNIYSQGQKFMDSSWLVWYLHSQMGIGYRASRNIVNKIKERTTRLLLSQGVFCMEGFFLRGWSNRVGIIWSAT